MLTQCPNCQTMFRVTSEILRVADGQVRCGRCQRQFDALERLIEENDEQELPGRGTDRDAAEADDIEVEEPETHEDITMEGRHIEISGTYRVPDEFGNDSAAVQQETIEEWVEFDDVDEPEAAPEQAEESAEDAASTDDADRDLFERGDSASVDATPDVDAFVPAQTTPVRTTGSPRFAQRQAARERAAEVAVEEDLLGLSVRHERQPKIWRYLAVPLALLLIVQWVHSYRAPLARHPTIGPAMLSTYRSLGIPLTPNWDLHAYHIRQWGVISDPSIPGTLRVRASVTNLADFSQPYPLLKLMLEDRWGEQIRAREFEPSEYLDPTVAPNRMLGPGQHANATIAIVDPGPDAEGFRFDVCLRGSAGTVCGEEVRRR
jgi:predicted Zn finger-like uncharacterized protein